MGWSQIRSGRSGDENKFSRWMKLQAEFWTTEIKDVNVLGGGDMVSRRRFWIMVKVVLMPNQAPRHENLLLDQGNFLKKKKCSSHFHFGWFAFQEKERDTENSMEKERPHYQLTGDTPDTEGRCWTFRRTPVPPIGALPTRGARIVTTNVAKQMFLSWLTSSSL